MKITKAKLKQIIKEELENVMGEEKTRKQELNDLIDARMKLVGFGDRYHPGSGSDLAGDFEAAKTELVDDGLATQEEMDAIDRMY